MTCNHTASFNAVHRYAFADTAIQAGVPFTDKNVPCRLTTKKVGDALCQLSDDSRQLVLDYSVVHPRMGIGGQWNPAAPEILPCARQVELSWKQLCCHQFRLRAVRRDHLRTPPRAPPPALVHPCKEPGRARSHTRQASRRLRFPLWDLLHTDQGSDWGCFGTRHGATGIGVLHHGR